jgi:hypothetical protein
MDHWKIKKEPTRVKKKAQVVMERNTYNSWIILSKLMTANRREAIAAPEMRMNATIRKREAVFVTVSLETF